LAVFSQNGGITTNAFANMLLGSTSSYQQDNKDVLQNIGYKTFQFYGQDSWKIKPRLTLEYGLRVAHLGAWTDREGIGLAVFDPVKYKDNPDLPGVSWHDLDKSIPVSGRNVDTLFWMPRIGFAYDIFGSGKTVLRGGAGIYYFNEAQGSYSAAAATAGGKRGTTLTNLTLAEIENQNPAGLPPSDITVVDPNDSKQPRTISYSLTVTQMLPLGIQFEASYVGNHSNFMSNDGKSNANYIPLGSLYLDSNGIPLANPGSDNDAALRRLNNLYGLNYGAINLIQHNTYSNYNGLHILASRQIGRVNFSTSYTFSKALGVRGINGVGGGLTDTNLSLGRDRAYGPLGLDRTHVFSLAYVVNLPSFGKNYFKNNRLARGVLDGWEMTGISQIASGPPIQAYNSNFGLSFTYTGFPEHYIGYNQRLVMGSTDFGLNPLLTCDPRSGLGNDQYMNLNCFAPPVQLVQNGGTYDTKLITNGPLVEPYAKGPAFFNNDLSVFKNWELTERKKMQFRISAFNLTNTPLKSLTTANTLLNYQFTRDPATGNVTGAWDAGTQANFGRFTDTKFGKRTIQLAIKFFF
ncbi:MAG: hypothetical protein J2P41_23235, partial [Blastocatellia bacterium]|nr:hypothetical protein [Blastocatellia bacterium]